jgi:replicative DNA helicase
MYQFSENIQRGIIYLLKSDKDFYLQIINLVKADYFEFPTHSTIFTVVQDYYEKYKTLPNDDFIEQQVKGKKDSQVALSEYSDELVYINKMDKSSLHAHDYFLDLIETFAKREAMKDAIKQSLVLIKEDRIEETEALVREALMVSRTVDVGQTYFDELSDRWDRTFNAETTTYKNRTLLDSINRSLDGGIGKKELAMVVAPPGVGKSVFLVNQGVTSLMEGKKVLYISMEMSEDKIAQRFDSATTLIPQDQIKHPGGQVKVKERLSVFQTNFSGSRLIIKEFPTGTINANHIRALLVQLKNYEDFVPDLILVDYLELMNPVRPQQREDQAQQKISEELRGIAMENDNTIWTATQTNRQGRSVKIITDTELADSYGKIRVCDLSISLNQTQEEYDNGRMRAYVMKSRNGRASFTIPMNIDYHTLRMTEGEFGDEDDE